MVERNVASLHDRGDVRVLIATDSTLIKAGLSLLLKSESTIDIVGEIDNSAQAAMIALLVPFDLVLIDFRSVEQGIAVARAVDRQQPRPLSLMVVEELDRNTMHAAVIAHISGCIRRPKSSPAILQAIYNVHQRRPGHGTLFMCQRE